MKSFEFSHKPVDLDHVYLEGWGLNFQALVCGILLLILLLLLLLLLLLSLLCIIIIIF